MTHRLRWTLWPVLVIGVALIVMPLAINLPTKARAGQNLLNAFRPIMQPSAVATTVAYQHVFQQLGPVATNSVAASSEVPALFANLSAALHMTEAQTAAYLTANFPGLAKLLVTFPALTPVFQNVPPGLVWYKPIIDTMHSQVNNFAKVDSLPNFNLLTWFFIVPGILLVLLAGFGLYELYRPHRRELGAVRTPEAPGQGVAA